MSAADIGVDMNAADLGVDMNGADMNGVDMIAADLGVDMNGADMNGVDMDVDLDVDMDVPNFCPPLSLTNGSVAGADGTAVYQDVATYTCNMDFELVGNATRNCQADGTWDGAQPVCQAVAGPCAGSPCGAHGVSCQPIDATTYVCTCGMGWTGADCDVPPDCGPLADRDTCNAGNLINLGDVPTGESRTFDIPAGALGFTILVQGDTGNNYGVARLVKPDGTVLINNSSSATIISFPVEQAFGLVMPPNDNPTNAVTAGTWQVTIASTLADSPNVQILVRTGPFAGGLHDLKIYIPTGLVACLNADCNGGNGNPINAANAATFEEIQGMLNTYFGEFYADEGGLSQGTVQFFNINNNAFLDIGTQVELDNLYRQSAIGGAGGMHFFLVQTFSGELAGVAGQASGYPGALTTANNRNAGVAVAIAGDASLNGNITGLTMAHEGGHFMGLFHTTELDGTPDLVSDTPSCDASTIGGANLQNCPDATFLMFPSLLDSMKDISNGQLITLRGGPLYR